MTKKTAKPKLGRPAFTDPSQVRRRGRPSLGDHGRTKVVAIKLSEIEYAKIVDAVRRENAEAKRDGGDGAVSTISSWIRDHALGPFGLSRYSAERNVGAVVVRERNGLSHDEERVTADAHTIE